MNVRYYSTQRPVGIGTFPKSQTVARIENFDRRTYCPEIGREAWGFIEYAEPITEKEADSYELVRMEGNHGK